MGLGTSNTVISTGKNGYHQAKFDINHSYSVWENAMCMFLALQTTSWTAQHWLLQICIFYAIWTL